MQKHTEQLFGEKMNCKICKNESQLIFEDTILGKYPVQYFHCENCGFLWANEPEKWLNKAYKNAINVEDTGILIRNEMFKTNLSIILYHLFDKDAKYLDFAGGYGILTRMMRDIGFDFYWYDKYCKNLTAVGFEGSLSEKFDAITSFESFEHFVNPIEEIEKMLRVSKTIIFSTELLANPIPKPSKWWYYGLSHGQHISFYSEKTLKTLGENYGLNYYNVLGLHILSDKILSKKIKNLNCALKKDKMIYKLIKPFVRIDSELIEVQKIKSKMDSKTFSDMQNIIASGIRG